MKFRRFAESARPVLVNGAAGMVAWAPDGEPFAVLSCTVRNGKITTMEVLADPERLREIDLTVVD